MRVQIASKPFQGLKLPMAEAVISLLLFKLPRNPFRDWNFQWLIDLFRLDGSNCLETLSGIETHRQKRSPTYSASSNCLETLSGIETNTGEPYRQMVKLRGSNCLETLSGIETSINSSAGLTLACSNCLETLSGIETVRDLIRLIRWRFVQIASKPFQGLKPTIRYAS